MSLLEPNINFNETNIIDNNNSSCLFDNGGNNDLSLIEPNINDFNETNKIDDNNSSFSHEYDDERDESSLIKEFFYGYDCRYLFVKSHSNYNKKVKENLNLFDEIFPQNYQNLKTDESIKGKKVKRKIRLKMKINIKA